MQLNLDSLQTFIPLDSFRPCRTWLLPALPSLSPTFVCCPTCALDSDFMSHDTSSSLWTDTFWIHSIFSWEASFTGCSHGHPHVILRETYSTFSEVFPSLLLLCYEGQFISFLLLSWLLVLSFVFKVHVVGALPSISSTWTSLYSLKSAR